jgi:hypothetical protein
MVPMMASLAAACIMIVIFASVIVALVMVAECLRLLAGRWFLVPAGSRWPSRTTSPTGTRLAQEGMMSRGCCRRSPTDFPKEGML